MFKDSLHQLESLGLPIAVHSQFVNHHNVNIIAPNQFRDDGLHAVMIDDVDVSVHIEHAQALLARPIQDNRAQVWCGGEHFAHPCQVQRRERRHHQHAPYLLLAPQPVVCPQHGLRLTSPHAVQDIGALLH